MCGRRDPWLIPLSVLAVVFLSDPVCPGALSAETDYDAFLSCLSVADSIILDIQKLLFIGAGSVQVPTVDSAINATNATAVNSTALGSNTTVPPVVPAPPIMPAAPNPDMGLMPEQMEFGAEEVIVQEEPAVIMLRQYERAMLEAMAWLEASAHKGTFLHKPLLAMTRSADKNLTMLKLLKKAALTASAGEYNTETIQQAFRHALEVTAQAIARNAELCRKLGVYTGGTRPNR